MIIRKLKEALGSGGDDIIVNMDGGVGGSWTIIEDTDEQEPFVGSPAPVFLEDDPWFGPATLSEMQKDYKAAYDAAVADNQLLAEWDDGVVESSNIHQEIYEIATQYGQTIEQPSGWMSGTGYFS